MGGTGASGRPSGVTPPEHSALAVRTTESKSASVISHSGAFRLIAALFIRT